MDSLVMVQKTPSAGFSKMLRVFRRLASRFPDEPKITALRMANADGIKMAPSRGDAVFAVQCLEDVFYFGLLSALSRQLRVISGAHGQLVVVKSISACIGIGWKQRISRSSIVVSLVAGQWIRAFKGVVDDVAYRSHSVLRPLTDLVDLYRSWVIWRKKLAKREFSRLQISSVPVGDLIIDSYLRFRPSPRFNVDDPFVRRLIWQAHRDVRMSRRYFRRCKPKVYLTSYSTYIEHGIAARAALLEGVSVRSFGSFAQFSKKLTLSDWFHTPDTSAYRTTFLALDRQEARLREAEKHLRARLAGAIDPVTTYMNVSAYASSTEPVPDVSSAVVVFLHDFYDSPHGYDSLVFEDFWDWTTFTIDVLRQSGAKFFIKPHPNQIALSHEVLRQLEAKYPGLPMLSSRVTNVQLAGAGILCGVTVFGTVAHELAYLGVPSIGCAKHPHHAFDFCRTARSEDQYRQFLHSPQTLPVSRDEMRRQSLMFYYMHNLYGDADSHALRASFISLWKAANGAEFGPATLVDRYNELLNSSALANFVRTLN